MGKQRGGASGGPLYGLASAIRRAAYSLLVVFVVLSLARLIGAPVATVLVVGYSMYPTLHYGDIVLVEKVQSLGSLRPGDIVVWCTHPLSCVIHRVVRVSDGYVITKGDNNPFPDPPVPASRVQYRAVFVVPRWAYLLPLAAAFVRDAASLLLLAGREPWRLTPHRVVAAAVLAYAAILVVLPMVAPSPPNPAGLLEALKPQVSLVSISLRGGGEVAARLAAENTGLHTVSTCVLAAGRLFFPCSAGITSLGNGTYLLTARPLDAAEFYKSLYLRALRRFELRANVSLDYGVLETRIPVLLQWRPVSVRMIRGDRGCSIVVVNPNLAPVEARLVVRLAERLPGPGFAVKSLGQLERNMTLAPGESLAIELPGEADYAAWDVYYVAPGGAWRGLHGAGSCTAGR